MRFLILLAIGLFCVSKASAQYFENGKPVNETETLNSELSTSNDTASAAPSTQDDEGSGLDDDDLEDDEDIEAEDDDDDDDDDEDAEDDDEEDEKDDENRDIIDKDDDRELLKSQMTDTLSKVKQYLKHARDGLGTEKSAQKAPVEANIKSAEAQVKEAEKSMASLKTNSMKKLKGKKHNAMERTLKKLKNTLCQTLSAPVWKSKYCSPEKVVDDNKKRCIPASRYVVCY